MPQQVDQPFHPDFSKELDIESLISAPLVAISKANVVMAQGQTRFLLEYCFNKIGDNYEPVMIRMALNRAVIVPAQPAIPGIPPTLASPPGAIPVIPASDGKPAIPAKASSIQNDINYFEIPLLTIIPLNSLAVDKINVNFNLDITSITAKPAQPANDSGNTVTNKKPQLYGKISNTRENSSTTDNENENDRNNTPNNNIKVDINASALPLPKGVLAIIDLYTKAIQPSPVESEKN